MYLLFIFVLKLINLLQKILFKDFLYRRSITSLRIFKCYFPKRRFLLFFLIITGGVRIKLLAHNNRKFLRTDKLCQRLSHDCINILCCRVVLYCVHLLLSLKYFTCQIFQESLLLPFFKLKLFSVSMLPFLNLVLRMN